MIKIDLKNILTEAEAQIKELAIAAGNKYKDQVIAAGKDIVAGLQTDLATWSQQLADGEITDAEFALLVKSYKVELAVSALKQAGMAEIASVELASKILQTIIDIATKLVSQLIK